MGNYEDNVRMCSTPTKCNDPSHLRSIYFLLPSENKDWVAFRHSTDYSLTELDFLNTKCFFLTCSFSAIYFQVAFDKNSCFIYSACYAVYANDQQISSVMFKSYFLEVVQHF